MLHSGDPQGTTPDYLETFCPASEPRTFLVQGSKILLPIQTYNNLTDDAKIRQSNMTLRWCRSRYYVQDVRARIGLPLNNVISYVPLSEPRDMPPDVFNISAFEASINLGRGVSSPRVNFPTSAWPDQSGFITSMPVQLTGSQPLSSFALGMLGTPMDSILDATTLTNMYQAAYQIMFARQMSTVLLPERDRQSISTGQISITTQAISVVPVFAYVVESLLAVVAMAALWLLLASSRQSGLSRDPSSISSLMSLAADDEPLLQAFKGLDKSKSTALEAKLAHRRFRLHREDNEESARGITITEPAEYSPTPGSGKGPSSAIDEVNQDHIPGVQPMEFNATTGVAFFACLLSLFIALPVLSMQIMSKNGLPLPSSISFVRQLLEKYLPTALGTFIEPFWLVLNRHLCILQPFESLRKTQRQAKDSISLNYSSFPPQFVAFKAIRRGHYLLGLVCTMTLLANFLSVALSGLFFESIVQSNKTTVFNQLYRLDYQNLTSLQQTGMLSSTSGGRLADFSIATSNISAQTTMPPWTDPDYSYLPFSPKSERTNSSLTYRAETSFLGAELSCEPISFHSSYFESDGTYRRNKQSKLINK